MRYLLIFIFILSGTALPAAPSFTEAKALPFQNFETRLEQSYKTPWRKQEFTREFISLNGYWNIHTSANADESMPKSDDFYFKVPGQVRGGTVSHFIRTRDGRAVNKINGVSTGWNSPNGYIRMRRPLNLPMSVIGKKLMISFEQIVCNEFRLTVNRQPVPVSSYFRAGKLDLTGILKPGNNTIECFLDLSGNPNEVSGGLVGQIMLEVLPENNLGEMAINTSLDKRRIDVEFFGETLSGKNCSLELTIADAADGKKIFHKTLPQKRKLSLDFVTPKLWSPDSPALYYMTVSARNAEGLLMDTIRRRFGFREFKTIGPDYFLNGHKLYLRGDTNVLKSSSWTAGWQRTPAYFRNYIRMLKNMNLNFCYAEGDFFSDFFKIADEEGFLLLVCRRFAYKEMWSKTDRQVLERLEAELKFERANTRLMNHPSQIGIVSDVWYNMHQGVMNPEYVGRRYASASYKTFDEHGKQVVTAHKDPNLDAATVPRRERLNRMTNLYRRYFPEFQVFTGADGEIANIFSTHLYHTWGAQNLEMRAFFGRWGLQRELPIFIGEYFIPYNPSLRRLDVAHGPESTPFYLENAARWFGNDAYLYKQSYTTRTWHDANPGSSVVSSTFDKKGQKNYYFLADFYSDMLQRSIEEVVPGFLYSGVRGIGSFGHAMEGYAGQLEKNFYTLPLPEGALDQPERSVESVAILHLKRPVFDLINAKPDYRYAPPAAPFRNMMDEHYAAFFAVGDDPYELDHAYYSEETLNKKLSVFNHSAAPVDWNILLTLSGTNGERILQKQYTLRVPAGERKDLPLPIVLPGTAYRREFLLTAELNRAGGNHRRASMTLELFPRPGTPLAALKAPVYVFGGEKSFLEALRKLGANVKIQKSLNNVPAKGIFLIGRNALASLSQLPPIQRLADQGLNILIMEQPRKSSKELMKTRSRQAFINAAGHPAFNGLKDRDFYCWRGSHSLAPKYQTNTPAKLNWSDNGNRNMVAANVFRRPEAGSCRALLVSGFDLYQTPLLEYVGTKGSWIASQLEITERLLTDPAATRVFVNLLTYLDSRSEFSGKTLFFGGSAGKTFLNRMKVEACEIQDITPQHLSHAGTLLISDPDFEKLDQARLAILEFVYHGGRIVYLHTGAAWRSTWLPFVQNLKWEKIRGVLTRPDHPDKIWRCGWDNNDLYWHDEKNLPLFDVPKQIDATEPAAFVRRKYGSGEFLFASVTPERFGATPAQGKISRVIAAIFASIGVKQNFIMQPYQITRGAELDLVPFLWEFALDPQNSALKEGWQRGMKGSAKWMQGQISNDGVHVRIGMEFERFLRRAYDGWVMYRLVLDIDEKFLKSGPLYFQAGAMDDFDEVYVNGIKIGQTNRETPKWWEAPRIYPIPGGVLKPGRNLIAVRIFDERGEGGITKTPVSITTVPSLGAKGWEAAYPEGSKRNYQYNPDVIRSY